MTYNMLTQGAISRAYHSRQVDAGTCLQVLEVKRIDNKSGPGGPAERYRMVLSDGENYQQGMLTTQLNDLVTSGAIAEFCVLRVNEGICNEVSARKIIIVIQCEIIARPSQAIGQPQNIEQAAKPPGGAPVTNAPYSAPFSAPQLMNKPPQQAPPSYLRSGPTGGQPGAIVPSASASQLNYHPIISLNPYQSRWTIKARVTAKSDMRTWSNQKGDGKLFSVDLLDAQGGQIRATMFNDAADKFHPIFQENRIYVISKGQLKPANKKFTRIVNDYEMTLNSDAEVALAQDDHSIQQQRFDFVPLEAVRVKNENDFCDVIGVVKNVDSLTQITAKSTGKDMKKRTVTLCDMSMLTVELTLWGEQAEKYNESELANNPVMAVKNVKVSNFGGKALTASYGSQIFINPDREESHRLVHWWGSQGSGAAFVSLTERSSSGGGAVSGPISDARKTLGVIRDDQLGFKEQADYLTVRATVSQVRGDFTKPPWYLSCPKCQKKVRDATGAEAWCEKCNQMVPEPLPRYILSLMAADHTHTQWMTAFSEQAQLLLGHSASAVSKLKEVGDEHSFKEVFDSARYSRWILKLKVKAEQQPNDGEMKARVSIIAAHPIEYAKEARLLLDDIKRYGPEKAGQPAMMAVGRY